MASSLIAMPRLLHTLTRRSFSTASRHTKTLSPSTSVAASQHGISKDQVMAADKRYILGTYARFPQMFLRGEGCYLYDSDDHEYLDFYAGIAVNALGHSDPDWNTALQRQAGKLTHISNLYFSQPQVQLAERLLTSCTSPTCCHNAANKSNSSESGNCFSKVFFCNTGTEANEGAIKFARKYSYTATQSDYTQDKFNSKTHIVSFNGGFHGRTVGSLSLTYKSAYRAPFAPLMPDVTFVDYNNVEALRAAVDEFGDKLCAIFVEPVQGEGGVFPATKQFMTAIRELCDQHNAIMVCDEVQCGVGRTGQLWAHSSFGVQPDIMTLAKPLANGLPIGAILVNDKIADVMKPGDHGSTFSGSPLVTSVADTVVAKIADPEFLTSVQQRGKLLYTLLAELQQKLESSSNSVQITEIRSMQHSSLLVGIDLNTAVKDIIVEAGQAPHRLLLISGGERTLRLAPPLIVNDEQIRYAVKVIEQLLTGRKQ